MRLLKAAALAVALVVGSATASSAQSLDFGSLGSSAAPQPPQLTETVTTPSGLTANYRVENCGGSYFIAGVLSAAQRGYVWLTYLGPKKGDTPGSVTYGTMPLWTGSMEAGTTSYEIPLGAAGSVINKQPAYLTFGFDPFGPGGIITIPDEERAVKVVIDPNKVQACS